MQQGDIRIMTFRTKLLSLIRSPPVLFPGDDGFDSRIGRGLSLEVLGVESAWSYCFIVVASCLRQPCVFDSYRLYFVK